MADYDFSILDNLAIQGKNPPPVDNQDIGEDPFSILAPLAEQQVNNEFLGSVSGANNMDTPSGGRVSRQGPETVAEGLMRGYDEQDYASEQDAIKQGFNLGMYGIGRGLNFIAGKVGLDPDAEADDDLLARKVEEIQQESRYPMSDTRYWLGAAAQMAPQVGAAAVGGIPGALAATGLQQTGEKLGMYDRVYEETGDRSAAATAAWTAGVLGTALDAYGVGKIVKPGPLVTRLARGFAAEGSTEAAQQVVDDLSEDINIMRVQGFTPAEIAAELKNNIGEYAGNAAKAGITGGVLGSGFSLLAQDQDAEPSRNRKLRQGGEFIEDVITPISSVLGRIDPRIPERLRRMQFDQNLTIQEQEAVWQLFWDKLKTLPADMESAVYEAILQDDVAVIRSIMGAEGDALIGVLQQNKADLDAVGSNANPDELFPLMAKDQGAFDRLLYALSADLVNPMKANVSKAKVLKRAKQELLNNPDSELSQFIRDNTLDYAASIKRQMTDDVETVAFQRLVGKDQNNRETSVPDIVRQLKNDGKISTAQISKINQVLRDYRTNRKTAGIGRGLKNLTLIDALGSPLHALSQLGDVGSAAYEGGIANAIVETVKAITGISTISMQDLGIAPHKLDAEFAHVEPMGLKRWKPSELRKLFTKEAWANTTAAVTNIFDLSGFTSMDKVGKTTLINVHAKRLQKMAKKQTAKLVKELEPLFPTQQKARSVVREFRDKQPSEYSRDAQFVLFSKLLRIQPIENSELPQVYLKLGNGRLLYTLKTFALKRLDFIRQESLNKMFSGDPKQTAAGLKNLMKIAVLIGGAEAGIDEIREWFKTGSFRTDGFVDTFTDNLAQILFTSDYKQQANDPVKAHIEAMLPVMKFPAAVVRDIDKWKGSGSYEIVGNKVVKSDRNRFLPWDARSIKSVPLLGEIISGRLGYDAARKEDRRTRLQQDYSELKRTWKLKAEKTGSRKALAGYRYLTGQQGKINKYTEKVNRLQKHTDRTGKDHTAEIKKLKDRRDKYIEWVIEQFNEKHGG